MSPQVTRRRFITITAAAAGLPLLPRGVSAEAPLVTWRGTVMGAVATMRICHPDRAAAERLVERAIAEVRRLEALFSLYREDSALVALNKHGALAAPAPELVDLLGRCARYSTLTDGAFDATVQPLWNLYAAHFARPDASPAGPAAEAVAAALARVGHAGVRVSRDRIVLARHGMQVTLNGIAQGYLTDRVVDLLRAEGITQTLVDMGEARGVGTSPEGRPWQVGIADPDRPQAVRKVLGLTNRAVATSGAYGFRFDPAGRFNHLFDPRTGASAHAYKSVSVLAPSATTADALSTAFSLMPLAAIDRVLAEVEDSAAYLVLPDGALVQRPQA